MTTASAHGKTPATPSRATTPGKSNYSRQEQREQPLLPARVTTPVYSRREQLLPARATRATTPVLLPARATTPGKSNESNYSRSTPSKSNYSRQEQREQRLLPARVTTPVLLPAARGMRATTPDLLPARATAPGKSNESSSDSRRLPTRAINPNKALNFQ